MNATSRFPTPRAANRPGSVPISMRGLFLLCFTINVSGVVLLAILSVLMSWNEERLNQKHDQRLNSYMLADELRQSSDDLTRMARTYVVTQDPRYEQMYRDILAIRNGTKPRPRDYNRIYWDLVLRAGEKPRPDGPAEALEHLMRRAGFTPEEFSLLRTAQANSDNLVRTETIAMNTVKGLYDDGTGSFSRRGDPDIPLATRLMHDAKYHAEKARIMAPIYDFFARLDQRTRADVDLYLSRGRILLLSIQAVVVLLIGLSIATGLLLPRAIFRRVGGEPFLVEHVVRRIAEGDLAVSIGTSGWARNGIMAAMRETTDRLRRVVRGVQAAVDVIAEGSQTMLVGSDSLAATAGEQATATAEAAAAMDQMAEAVAKTAENAQRTEQLTQVASQDARDSGEAVAETVVAMRSIAEKLSAVEGITRRTQMISINAAIEAARAGAVGREFAVVATEVRALAEHTQAITVEMNRLISLSRTIAEKAGAMLAKLIPDIEQTARLVSEISAHTRAQSEGARQIKIAIRQLVQGTHECSTSSSDLSALAERLSEESRRLQDSIAFFHLPDEETPAFPSGTVDPRAPRALPATAITRR